MLGKNNTCMYIAIGELCCMIAMLVTFNSNMSVHNMKELQIRQCKQHVWIEKTRELVQQCDFIVLKIRYE